MNESGESGKFTIRGDAIPPDFRESMNLEDQAFQEWLARNEFLPDAERRFNETLERLGLEPVTELPNGYQYLSMMELLWLRYTQNEFFRLYPTFVRDKATGDIHFCKAKIRKNIWFGGPQAEHDILRAVPENIPAPRALHYVPEGPDTLETVVTTAKKLSECSLGRAEVFTPDHVRQVVGHFKQLETIPIAERPNLSQEPAESIEHIFSRRLFTDSHQDVLPPEFRSIATQTLEGYQPYSEPVLIHGDGTVGNVVLFQDGAAELIDWERGGAGYRGQDSAKLLWQLWEKGNLASAEAVVATYLEGESFGEGPLSCQLRFGIVFEALRQVPSWRDTPPADLESRLREIYTNMQQVFAFVERITSKSS